MYDLDTIRKMNKESGNPEELGEAMTYAEICAAADAEQDIDAECWDESRNDR